MHTTHLLPSISCINYNVADSCLSELHLPRNEKRPRFRGLFSNTLRCPLYLPGEFKHDIVFFFSHTADLTSQPSSSFATMPDSTAENEVPFLPKDHEAILAAPRDHRSGRATRVLIVTVALVSALVSAVGTVVMHNILQISSIATSSSSAPQQEFLPSLELAPLGSVLRTYMGEPAYYGRDMNATREAWMALFPGMLFVRSL